jgi:hypothetical protein
MLACVVSDHTLRVGFVIELGATVQGGSYPWVTPRWVYSVELMVGKCHWSVRIDLELWRMTVECHLVLKVEISQTGGFANRTVFVELAINS